MRDHEGFGVRTVFEFTDASKARPLEPSTFCTLQTAW